MISSPARSMALLLVLSLSSALSVSQETPKPTNVTQSSIAGIWLGALHTGGAPLRIQLHLQAGAGGDLTCSVDSIDQKIAGIPCNNVQIKGNDVSFDVTAVKGKWAGHLSADGKILDGTWTQDNSLPLSMERQTTAIEVPKAPPPDPAMP